MKPRTRMFLVLLLAGNMSIFNYYIATEGLPKQSAESSPKISLNQKKAAKSLRKSSLKSASQKGIKSSRKKFSKSTSRKAKKTSSASVIKALRRKIASLIKNKHSTYKRIDLIYSIPVKWSNKFILPISKFIPEDQKFKPALGVAVGIGKVFTKHFRGDLVASYRGNYKSKNIDASSKIDNISFMANGYITPEVVKKGSAFEKFKPYIMGGVGLSLNRQGDIQVDPMRRIAGAHTRNLAWQVGLGATYTPAGSSPKNKVRWDLGYRYMHLGRIKTGQYAACANFPCGKSILSKKGKLHSHEFSVGLTIIK